MALIQDYASTALQFYNTADPYLRPVRNAIASLQARTLPLLTPLLNKAVIAAQDSPSIVVVGILLLFFVVAMQILSFVRRIMMFTLRLIWWSAIAAVLVAVGSVIWQRGPERVLDDVVSWGSHLSEFWWGEYEKHKQAQARGQKTYFR